MGVLKLTWHDCGDDNTFSKMVGLTPDTITPGQPTSITGTAILDREIFNATFHLKMTGLFGVTIADCEGDASILTECPMAFGVGKVTFKGLTFPLHAGSTSVSMDTESNGDLPAVMAS